VRGDADMFSARKTGPYRSVTAWRRWVIVLAITSLSLSLATRVFHFVLPHGVTVDASVSQGMRQYLDSDGTHWVAPVSRFICLQPVTYYPKFAPAVPPLSSNLFDESLYNRPPPFPPTLA
jgi:hypothetical protein